MPSLSRSVPLAAATALALGLIVGAAGADTLHPIALTGVDGPLGPNAGPGVRFASFALSGRPLSAPALTGTSYISFAATLTGSGIDSGNNEALFVIRGHGTEMLARKGSQAAGLATGISYARFVSEAALSDTGKAAFLGVIAGPGGAGVDNFTNDCFWVEPPTGGPLSLVVRENVITAPGTPGTLFGDQANPGFANPTMWGDYSPVMSVNGTAMQRCGISSPGDGPQWGIWYNPAGPLASFYINCVDTLAGSDPVRTFCGSGPYYINASGATINARGDSISGGGLWSTRALDGLGHGTSGTGPLSAVALAGQLAPNSIETWDGFDHYSQNKNGRVVFSAAFPGVPLSGGGIWSDGRFGVLQSIALTGGAAPGSPSGTFHLHGVSIAEEVLIADNNSVTFQGRMWQAGDIGPNNDQGLWSNRALSGPNAVGNLRSVFIESDPVPAGLGPDYAGLTFLAPIHFWVNASGRSVVFVNHNDFTRGLWMEQPNGSLLPIVKEFTLFDVFGNGTDQRLVTSIVPVGWHASSGSGIRTMFNDNGDVVFRLTFADGSEGIFTTAPAPTAPCAADFNQSGGVSVQDIFDFLAAYFTQDLRADVNASGGVSVQDVFDFLVAYFIGCP
jgi:hypothetical protein